MAIVPSPDSTPLTPSAQAYLNGELRWQRVLLRRRGSGRDYLDIARARRARLRRSDASVEGVEDVPRYSDQQMEALAAKGLAYKCRNGAYLAVVDRRDLLDALKLSREAAESDRLPLKAFIKKRAVLLRLEELLPASWQLKVPPLREGDDES